MNLARRPLETCFSRAAGLQAQAQADIRDVAANARSDAAGNNGSYANVTLDYVQQGISTDDTTFALSRVAAVEFCIQGTNTTNTAVRFFYLKFIGDITAGT